MSGNCWNGGAIAGYGVSTGNALLPIAAFIAGIVLIASGRRKVTEIIEDERIHRISEKASRRVLEIFTTAVVHIDVILIAMNEYAVVDYILAFSACALLVLYLYFTAITAGKALIKDDLDEDENKRTQSKV